MRNSVCVSLCLYVCIYVRVMPSRRCLMLSQRGLIQIIRSIKSLSLPLSQPSLPLIAHTHARTHACNGFSYVPVLAHPLGGAVYPDRKLCPIGVFWKQTQRSHGCSSPCCVKTSDQLHSAWPVWTYSQRYCCLIWHLCDAFTWEILLCFTQYEHLILWWGNQCRHLYLRCPVLTGQTHMSTQAHLWDSCSIIYVHRCDLHISQLVWIHFNMSNLMVEIDAYGRVGWVCIHFCTLARSLTCPSDRKPDWITTSHFPLKWKTNEMPLLHAMLLPGQNWEELWPFPVFLSVYQYYLFYFFLSPIFSWALILLSTPWSHYVCLFFPPPSFVFSLHVSWCSVN